MKTKQIMYRRYIDLKKKEPLKKVLKNLKNRRKKDRSRKHSALQKHPKSVVIRSDFLSKKKMILKMTNEINKVMEQK